MSGVHRWSSLGWSSGFVVLLLVSSCSWLGPSTDPLTDGAPCPTGSQLCGSVCIDITTNAAACGACGNACPAEQVCIGGRCQVGCPGGQVACESLCYATNNDPRHCGDCTTACKPGEVCGDAHCTTTCPAEQTNCDGSCANFQTDSKHCGACGVTCGPDDECVDGQCVIACKSQLNQPITDRWGWSWDGLERAATTYPNAMATCASFRGRLPTASELYRVSATQSATVGQTINTNPLWSLAPLFPGSHARIRLSDAALVSDPAGNQSSTNYRCVCPPVLPKAYVGGNCFGDADTNPCVTLGDEAKRHNIDSKDRPVLPKGAAAWECAFYGGHLASSTTMVEAIQQGVGNGTGQWLHVGNEVRNDLGALLQFIGDGKDFRLESLPTMPANSAAWDTPTTAHAFRCVGENFTPNPLPAIAGEWSESPRRKMEASDFPLSNQLDATVACFDKGGHLPSTVELNELVVQGLPAGSGTFLWTSDQTGFDGQVFTVSVVRWKGVELEHLYGGADMGWGSKNAEMRPYRCLYYPIDASYMGPGEASCKGGCTTIAMPGNLGAKMWFDSMDRPGANLTNAIDACQKLGGHLPSERDMTEAIRAGLPNGVGPTSFLFASDILLGNCGNGTADSCGKPPNVLTGVVQWTGTDPNYDNRWNSTSTTPATWSWSTDVHAFRCMWTNELR